MTISLILAAAPDGLIGANNRLPWHLPGDLKRFRKRTWGKPIVMGRRTFESLGKPLEGRRNIVLSRQPGYHIDGCEVASSLAEAIALARDATEVMVIGGSAVLREALSIAQRVYLTTVQGEFEGDTYFPLDSLGPPEWKIASEEFVPPNARNPYPQRFSIVERTESVFPPCPPGPP